MYPIEISLNFDPNSKEFSVRYNKYRSGKKWYQFQLHKITLQKFTSNCRITVKKILRCFLYGL